jgi:hypothetical protein
MDQQLTSGIYTGLLHHARWQPKQHQFQYAVFMAYIDLDEIPALCSRSILWSHQTIAPFWIRRKDYFGDPNESLKQSVYQKVQQELGFQPNGPVRMLTNPRCFGLRMNPISVFYVFDANGTQLQAVLAEVTNTPWDKRHVYAIDYRSDVIAKSREFGKALHVSPFMPMQQKYRWQTNLPAQNIRIRLQNLAVSETPQREELGAERKTFEALLLLDREECTTPVLTSLLWRFPWMTAKVLAAIYWQAIKLLFKHAKFYAYPPSVDASINSMNDVDKK